ncbi:hypothetical protein IFM89_011482 [Coptis chinensis]|uniref:Uncharacterized protein n=1 Tax=Coptis chinensis TaxID=261450 RepID=A0A835MEV0_9MAGN|nr:hypothetical protein IFM89_011482 [Coptis chinensis]
MELPQPRPIGTEGKKPTHDFLSLYSHSSFPDPRPSQGNFLKTHDFLQPLERGGGKNGAVGEKTVDVTKVETPSPPSPSPSVEHILPGGIGTYTISHISNFSQHGLKTEQTVGTVIRASSAERNGEINKANSSSNSISGGVFAFWEESSVKEKGRKVKDIVQGQVIREGTEKLGQWSSETPFLHSSNSFNSLSTSKPAAQKSQSFMEMMKSGRGLQEDDEDDDDEFANSSKKSSSSLKDGKSGEQKANTPRSKHSATEQRRRSKINDRQVIEYIQYLQEKVNRYETSYQGWNQEPAKLTPWRNGQAPGDNVVDHSQALKSGPGSGPTIIFNGKFDDNISPNPTMLANAQNPVEPGLSTSATYKAIDHHAELSSKSGSMPISMQPNMFSTAVQPQQLPISDGENMVSQSHSQLWPIRPCPTACPIASDTVNEQEEMQIEGGTISLAGVYSQGLLNNLTQALQSSGVDLSQASIAVQVDVGKRAMTRLNALTSGTKEDENPSSNRAMPYSRVESSGEDSDQSRKRIRTA